MTIDPSHDFDFHFGNWHAHHRRLKDRLADCTEWVEFDGTAKAWPLLGGNGNMDDNVFDAPGGVYRGVTLRAFDPNTNVAEHHADLASVGAGLLARRRQDLGDELGDGVHEGKSVILKSCPTLPVA